MYAHQLILFLGLSVVLIGCAVKVEELIGEYSVTYSWGSETLLIKSDGS